MPNYFRDSEYELNIQHILFRYQLVVDAQVLASHVAQASSRCEHRAILDSNCLQWQPPICNGVSDDEDGEEQEENEDKEIVVVSVK